MGGFRKHTASPSSSTEAAEPAAKKQRFALAKPPNTSAGNSEGEWFSLTRKRNRVGGGGVPFTQNEEESDSKEIYKSSPQKVVQEALFNPTPQDNIYVVLSQENTPLKPKPSALPVPLATNVDFAFQQEALKGFVKRTFPLGSHPFVDSDDDDAPMLALLKIVSLRSFYSSCAHRCFYSSFAHLLPLNPALLPSFSCLHASLQAFPANH